MMPKAIRFTYFNTGFNVAHIDRETHSSGIKTHKLIAYFTKLTNSGIKLIFLLNIVLMMVT